MSGGLVAEKIVVPLRLDLAKISITQGELLVTRYISDEAPIMAH